MSVRDSLANLTRTESLEDLPVSQSLISLVLPSIYGRGKEVRYDEFKNTGYRPPELGDNGKPPYQIVFDHDFESKIIRVLMPGFAVNGTYFVIVENDNDKASFDIFMNETVNRS